MKIFRKQHKKVTNLWRLLEETETGFLVNTNLYERTNNHYDKLAEVNQLVDGEEYCRLRNLYRKGKVYVK